MEYYKKLKEREKELQQQRRRRRGIFTFLPLLLAVGVFAFGMNARTHTALSASVSGTYFLLFALEDGETFEIRYAGPENPAGVTAAVQRSGSLLVLRSVLFHGDETVLPDAGEYENAEISETEEGILLSGIDREQALMELVTGTETDHVIVFRGEPYRLADYVPPQTRVLLRIESVNLGELRESASSGY